jgi:hypothetical protein
LSNHSAPDGVGRPFLELLLEIYELQESGVVEVRAESVTTIVYFLRGQPVSVEGGVLGQTIGRVLLSQGVLDDEQYAKIITAMTDKIFDDEHVRFGEVAVRLGFLGVDQVHAALLEQVRLRVMHCMQWDEPICTFRAGDDALEGLTPFPCGVEALVLDGLKEYYDAERLSVLVSGMGDQYPWMLGERADIGRWFQLSDDEARFVNALSSEMTIAQTLLTSTLDAEHANKLVIALFATGMLYLSDEAGREEAEPTIAELAQQEALRKEQQARQQVERELAEKISQRKAEEELKFAAELADRKADAERKLERELASKRAAADRQLEQELAGQRASELAAAAAATAPLPSAQPATDEFDLLAALPDDDFDDGLPAAKHDSESAELPAAREASPLRQRRADPRRRQPGSLPDVIRVPAASATAGNVRTRMRTSIRSPRIEATQTRRDPRRPLRSAEEERALKPRPVPKIEAQAPPAAPPAAPPPGTPTDSPLEELEIPSLPPTSGPVPPEVRRARLKAEAAFRDGRRALRQGNFNGAATAFRRAQLMHPEAIEYELHAEWSELQLYSHEREEREDLLTKLALVALKQNNRLAFAYYVQGQLLLRRQDYKASAKAFARAYQLDKTDQDAKRHYVIAKRRSEE